jgi:DNA-binding CsgD family transcriptional regulator
MSGQEHRAGDSHFAKWMEAITPIEDHAEVAELSVARNRAADEAAIARQLNGPLTALLLYMNEIRQHSHQFSQAPGTRVYLQQVVENALQQTERVCALVKQMSDNHLSLVADADRRPRHESPSGRSGEAARTHGATPAVESGRKPLTRREREVLSLISEGCSNKQGALRMNISPRTFESHRAEAMRKLGARNTADLVRKALQQPA